MYILIRREWPAADRLPADESVVVEWRDHKGGPVHRSALFGAIRFAKADRWTDGLSWVTPEDEGPDVLAVGIAQGPGDMTRCGRRPGPARNHKLAWPMTCTSSGRRGTWPRSARAARRPRSTRQLCSKADRRPFPGPAV